jgi:hypothetical protein
MGLSTSSLEPVLATKRSIAGILGLVLVLAVWEVAGAIIEHRDVLHEEGEDAIQPTPVASGIARPAPAKVPAVSARPTATSASPAAYATRHPSDRH